MRQTLKGLLCSALIFPGAGHMALQAPKRGSLLILLSIAILGYIVMAFMPLVSGIVSQVAENSLSVNQTNINDLLQHELIKDHSDKVSWGIWALIGIWVIALVDVFLVGVNLDRHRKRRRAL